MFIHLVHKNHLCWKLYNLHKEHLPGLLDLYLLNLKTFYIELRSLGPRCISSLCTEQEADTGIESFVSFLSLSLNN